MSVTNNTDLFLPTEISVTGNLAETAAKIAFATFEWRYISLLFFNATVLGVINFLEIYDKGVLISSGLSEPSYADDTEQYVIFGLDVPDLISMLDWMQDQNFDNTGKYIVICESDEPDDCDETEAVNTFWYHRITNVIFLKHLGDIVVPYTYYYSEKTCAMSEPVRMENFDYCLSNMSECEMFPQKLLNLHGCPLIASTFEQPPYMTLTDGKPTGADGELLLIITASLNASLQVMTPNQGDGWGSLDENGTWLGSLGDVYYDLANISITSASLTLKRFSYFQLSYYYNFVIIGWVTSPTELEPSSLKLLRPFRLTTHVAIGIVFIFVIVIAFLMRSKLWTKHMTRSYFNSQSVVFYSWMLCMGTPMIRLPKKPFFLYITFVWIWYTFFVRTMYQAALINSLKSNMYASNIETVEEAIAANYRIAGGHALKDNFINYPLVYDRYEGLDTTKMISVLKKISRGENSLMAMNLESVGSFVHIYGGSLHIVKQRILVSPTAIFFKKYSPLADRIDLVLQKLFEGGVPDALYRYYVHPHRRKPKSVDSKEPLRTEHYNGCYTILFTGWAISVVCFIFEVCVGARNKLFVPIMCK